MDIYEFLTESVSREYTTVKVLKDSRRSRITLLRHNKTGAPFVFRQFTGSGEVYRRLLTIHCPHLPRVMEVGEKDGRVAVLEEYISGERLDTLLEAGLFSENEVRKTAKEILAGLQVLHSIGAVHRDIKPENIILREGGAVLIDFDASRIYKETQSADTHILGTTGYAAPEQFGVTQTDHRADIYAMGVLMNIMLTGKHPSKAMAGGKMGRIISKCTMMDPDKRYKSCEALLGALSAQKAFLPAMILSILLIPAILLVLQAKCKPSPLPAVESSVEEALSAPTESPSLAPTESPSLAPTESPSLAPTSEPSPSPTPSEAPVAEARSAEATYIDETGEYHLFLCFDAGMISRRETQESRLVELPPDTRTGVPSILTVYRAGSPEDVTEEFRAKIETLSVDAVPTGEGTHMELFHGELTPEFSGALHLVSISMAVENVENEIRWTLTMENGQVITLSQLLTITETDTITVTSNNVDLSTLEQLQQVIDYIGNDAGEAATVDIYLPAGVYEGDLFIRYRGVNLIGSSAGTTLKGTLTVTSPISQTVMLQNITLTGQGGTGVEAHAPVILEGCQLSGYDIAAACYDGGSITAHSCHIRDNGVGLHLDSDRSGHTDVGYTDDTFENNDVAIRILAIDSDATMIFPGTVFSGNGQDIDNPIGYPVDTGEASFR